MPLKNVEFPNFGRHLEFWQKLQMSFISKTLGDRVISSNVWTLWILETLDIVPVKKSLISRILSAILNFGGN